MLADAAVLIFKIHDPTKASQRCGGGRGVRVRRRVLLAAEDDSLTNTESARERYCGLGRVPR